MLKRKAVMARMAGMHRMCLLQKKIKVMILLYTRRKKSRIEYSRLTEVVLSQSVLFHSSEGRP